MHTQTNECPCLALVANEVERIVMFALLSGDRHPYSRAELERELSGSKEKAIDVEDAIENLYAAGLLNVAGDLVTPSRAARHFDALMGQPI
jgi:hypothetical protein